MSPSTHGLRWLALARMSHISLHPATATGTDSCDSFFQAPHYTGPTGDRRTGSNDRPGSSGGLRANSWHFINCLTVLVGMGQVNFPCPRLQLAPAHASDP